MKKLSVVLVASMLSVACAGAKVKANPAEKFPLGVSDATPAFLFPVNMSHLGAPGKPDAMGLMVTGGVISKFGKTVISGQQLFDLVGNLSFELAEQIKSQADANSWTMTGSAEQTASKLADLMENIIKTLVKLKLLDKPLQFKYIIAVHSHGSPGLGGKLLNVETWGGVYDVETKQIASYISSSDSYANEEAAVLAQLPMAYNGIIEKLLAGTEKTK